MFSKVFSVSVNGLSGNKIDVELDVSNGMPAFNIVGLPDAAIQESKESLLYAMRYFSSRGDCDLGESPRLRCLNSRGSPVEWRSASLPGWEQGADWLLEGCIRRTPIHAARRKSTEGSAEHPLGAPPSHSATASPAAPAATEAILEARGYRGAGNGKDD